MNIIDEKLTTFHWFQIILISVSEQFKTFFYNFMCFTLTIISMLSLFECITCSSSLSIDEIKLFAIANRIFHVSHFSRLFIASFKYGLILLRYSSTIVLCFHHHHFHIPYNYYTKGYLLLLVYNNFLLLLLLLLLYAQKNS